MAGKPGTPHPCAVPYCDRTVIAAKFCPGHRRHLRVTGLPRPIRRYVRKVSRPS